MRNKILSLLVLLLTAATGAWAQGLYNVFEVTQDMVASWTNDKTAVSAADLPTFGAVTEDEAKAWTGAPATGLSYLIYDFNGEKTKYVKFEDGKWSSVGEYNWIRSEMQGDISKGIKIFYTGLFVIPGATAGTWTFTMPGSNVMLTPVYAPVAKWAVSSEVDQIPTAIDGIFAGEAKDIVKAGTVAKVGSTENAQGTVMYAVTTENKKPTSTEGFSATVPTGAVLTGSYTENQTVYVWYYIKGIDAAEGVTPTAENTFSDSEICTTPIKVTVLSNKFDIQFNAANANTIEAGKATVTVGGTAATVTEGKLEGVKMGSEVKIKANTGYKFRKVEAKKKELPKYADVVTICKKNGDNKYLISSFFDGTNANITTITKEEAIALAEYLGGGNIFVVYEEYEISSYRYVRTTNAAGNVSSAWLSTTNTFNDPVYYVPAVN